MLALKGNTGGEHDIIVNDLIKVHQRFQARVSEYRTLLNMSIKFYKDLDEVCLYFCLAFYRCSSFSFLELVKLHSLPRIKRVGILKTILTNLLKNKTYSLLCVR